MPKYIEVNALKRKIRSGKAGYNLTKKELATVFCDINNTPSADVVEVIRCKDCKKYKPYAYPYLCGECGNCSYDVPAKIVKEDGYCNEGERKEAE